MNTLTYNQLIAWLHNIATAHRQIQYFGAGELWEINGTPKRLPKYPVLWMVPVSAQINDNTIDHTFRLLVFDLVSNGESNEDEVLSDTALILQDVVKVLKYTDKHFALTNSPTLEPFTERFADNVSGWSCECVVEVPYFNSACDVPIDEFVTPSVIAGGVSAAGGFSGVSGFSGASGFSGYSGVDGGSGFSGYSGAYGLSGHSGYSGHDGGSGVSGYSGYSGSSTLGFSGFSGYSGSDGLSGFSGASVSGFSGHSGATGGGAVEVTISGDVTTTTSASRVDITGFSVAVAANSTYVIEFFARVGCSGTGGLAMGFNLPSGATGGYLVLARGQNSTTQVSEGGTQSADWASSFTINGQATAAGYVQWQVKLVTGANAGTFVFRYRSWTPGQTSTIYADSSWMRYKQIA